MVARLLFLFVLLAAAPLAAQQQIDHEAEYRACMTLTRNDPNAALQAAEAWLELGGGEPARHCIAVAKIAQGRFGEAAQDLENLANTLEAPVPDLRSEMLAQAAQAWSMAGDLSRALAAQTAGLQALGTNIELRIDRAITLASLDRYWDAIDDLNAANEQAPSRADILVYRASAYRQVEAYDLAMEDADRALHMDPSNPEGFLERGLLHFANGDTEAARADWQQIMLIAPGTPAAQIAEENLTALRASEGQ